MGHSHFRATAKLPKSSAETSGWMPLPLVPLLIPLLLTACAGGAITAHFAGSGHKTLAGRLAFTPAQASLAGDCAAGTALLYPLGAKLGIDQPVATAALDPAGRFVFEDVGSLGLLAAGATTHIVAVAGCDGFAARIVTGYDGQDITAGSTLVSYALPLAALPGGQDADALMRIMQDLTQYPTMTAAYAGLNAAEPMRSAFQTVFGFTPDKLADAPPRILALQATGKIKEREAAAFRVAAAHWRPDYKVAYQWKNDNQFTATVANYTYTPSGNAQGMHTVSLYVGKAAAGSDQLDMAAPYVTWSGSLDVDDALPPTAPALALTGGRPAEGALYSISRALTLTVATGADLSNCETFSALALTENVVQAPLDPAAYTIKCSDSGLQSLAYTLKTAGDGLKSLRLWVIDAAGHISAKASQLDVTLDETAPALQTLALDGDAADGYISAAEKAQPHALVSAAVGPGFDQAAYQVAPAAMPCDDTLTYQTTLPLNTSDRLTGDGAYKVCVKLTDFAGHPPAFGASAAFTVTTSHPVFTSLDLVNDAVDGYINHADKSHAVALVGNLTGTGYTAASYAVVLSGSTCLESMLIYHAAVPQNTDSALASDGLYKVCVRLTDLAGNATYGSSGNFTLKNTPPAFGALPLAGAALDGFVNAAEHAGTAALVGGLAATGYDTATYSLAAAAVGCTSSLAYGAAPTSDSVNFGADGSYKVCVALADAAGNAITYAASPTFVLDTAAPQFTSLALIGAAANGYLNAAERAASTVIVGTLTGSNYDTAAYTLVQAGVVCSAATGYGASAPKSDAAVSGGDDSYKVCVKLTDQAGNPAAFGASAAVTIDTAAPGAFAITGPGPVAGTTAPSVTWQAATGAATYDVTVATDASCLSPVTAQTGVAATHLDVTGLSEAATYHACVVARDSAGNTLGASNNGSAFLIDSQPPAVTALSVNSGAVNTANNNVTVAFAATDTTSKIVSFCLKYNDTTAPAAGDACWHLVNAPSPGVTPAGTVSFPSYSFRLGFGPGTYAVYGWAKDEGGNISALSSSGAGTAGTDKASIDYIPGTPPAVSDILVANTDAPHAPVTNAEVTFTPGQNAFIKWRATDDQTLPADAISLYSTADDRTYTLIAAGLANGQNGACQVNDSGTTADDLATGCYVWTGGRSDAGYFRIRVAVKDSAGMTTFASSLPLNVTGVKLLAGNTEIGIGASATAAVFFSYAVTGSNPDPQSFAVAPSGVIYFRAPNIGVLSVSPNDGILNVLIPTTGVSSGDGGPAAAATLKDPSKILLDFQNRLLIFDYDRIRRYDPTTGTVTTIIGGGASNADDIDALSVAILPRSINSAKQPFYVLPNGNILFKAASLDDMTLQIYDGTTHHVKNIVIGGTGDNADPATDLSTCQFWDLDIAFNPVTSALTLARVLHAHGPSLPSCYSASPSGLYTSANLDGTTLQAAGPHPWNGNYTWYLPVSGQDGSLYLITRLGAQIARYDQASETAVRIAGTGVSGSCPDGTPALSCDMDPLDAFVNAAGKLYFVDRGRIRTLDDSGNVVTIAGQALSYGDSGPATAARFNVINDLTQLDDGRIIVLDQQEARIREFTPGGTIATIAGNGRSATQPDTVNPATAQGLMLSAAGPFWDNFAADPATGEVYFNRLNYLAKLNRTTGKWVDVAGGGSFSYADPAADGKLGSDIKEDGYPALVLGFSGSDALVAWSTYNGTTLADAYLKLYAAADGTQSNLAGKLGLPSSGDLCADGTALDNCEVRSPYGTPYSKPTYDALGGRWLVTISGANHVRSLVPGGTMATLATLPRGALSTAYHRSADLTTNELFYCGGDGRLYKYDIVTSTETTLPWPIPSMSCGGHAMVYNSAHNSVIFPYRQNTVSGVAEYYLP